MNLSEIFSAVAHKELVAVEIPEAGSNQHELNGVSALKEMFGTHEATRGNLSWRLFEDDSETDRQENEFTFYDARARGAARTGRSEWRFYYRGDFLKRAFVGDVLVLARTRDGRVYGLVFRKDSAYHRVACALFGISTISSSFRTINARELDARQVELMRRRVLDELELGDLIPAAPSDLELMKREFGTSFPESRRVSAFARSVCLVDESQPDVALTRWLEREEQLFRAFEGAIIGERISRGFASVDEFIQYSLSVQNRRKSRMGLALQNHLSELFTRKGLRFGAQVKTDGTNRPDFLFPGEKEYRDRSFDSALLVMLGAKSTAKDRWRQVLTEADRVRAKHLCTLEPGISALQTDEMRRQRLTLVVPSSLHATYTSSQRREILSIAEFIEHVARKQKAL